MVSCQATFFLFMQHYKTPCQPSAYKHSPSPLHIKTASPDKLPYQRAVGDLVCRHGHKIVQKF